MRSQLIIKMAAVFKGPFGRFKGFFESGYRPARHPVPHSFIGVVSSNYNQYGGSKEEKKGETRDISRTTFCERCC